MDVNSFVIGYTKGKQSAGGGSMEGFHKVQFFNDDRTTLLYTVFVPHGASAMYAGETPTSAIDSSMVLAGFEPSPANVTEDMDCFAVYEHAITTLDAATWDQISQLSANGKAQNYFAVGDTKMIHIAGRVGALDVNDDFGVYILGFDHNEELEGKGIHFGTFKTSAANGVDIALYNSDGDTAQKFNINHWGGGKNGGWSACDIRYDILGSTDIPPSNYGVAKTSGVVGYDATETCATTPVANTLMAALPADLRAVMKPMTKYTYNSGVTATIDYLPLPSMFEIMGSKSSYTFDSEKAKQRMYDYFTAGNSSKKYYYNNLGTGTYYLLRSPSNSTDEFAMISNYGGADRVGATSVRGIAPIFKV